MSGTVIEVGATVGFVVQSNAKTQTFFSDKLYTNKTEAAVREILHNARDSQVENGNGDEPLLIHFPTKAEPWFSVIDNGLGMSHPFMTSTFVTFSESTKDDPAVRMEVAGRLGLGSKSPFAVADEFVVISRYDGVQTSYRLYKSPRGNAMDVLASDETAERNGVEVRWDVPEHRFNEYRTALVKVLTYFTPAPQISGVNQGFGGARLPVVIEGKGYRILQKDNQHSWGGRPRAIMGGIIYPIDATQIPGLSEKEQGLLGLHIDIDFPLGGVEFAISREALEYVQKTQTAIKVRLAEVLKDLRARVDAEYTGFETFFEAARHLRHRKSGAAPLQAVKSYGDAAEQIRVNSLNGEVYKAVVGIVGARWRKRDISDGGFKLSLKDYPSLGGVSYSFHRAHSGSARLSRAIDIFGAAPIAKPNHAYERDYFFVPAIQNLRIYRDDMDTGAGVRFKEALTMYQDDGVFVALIKASDADFARIEAELEGVKLHSIQEITRPEAVRRKASVRKLMRNGSRTRDEGVISKDNLWESHVDMDEGGLYVVTKVNDLQGQDPVLFAKRYRALREAGLFNPETEELAVVPASLQKDFERHPKWKLAFPEFEARAAALLAKPATWVSIEHYRQHDALSFDHDNRPSGRGYDEVLANLPKDHPWNVLQARIDAFAADYKVGNAYAQVAHAFGNGLTTVDLGVPLVEQNRALVAKYPLLLPSLNGVRFNRYDETAQAAERAFYKSVAEYVKLIDGPSAAPPAAAAPEPKRRQAPGRQRYGWQRPSKARGGKAQASA